MKTFALFATLVVLFCSCATTYQPSSFTGGYEDLHIEGNVYRITFTANGYSDRETAQTYWLYRAAELTIEKGFKSFTVLSDINFASRAAQENLVATMIYMPVPVESNKPHIIGDILLSHEDVPSNPPKIFNAPFLLKDLEHYVKGEKCSIGNVCPHLKKYLGHKPY